MEQAVNQCYCRSKNIASSHLDFRLLFMLKIGNSESVTPPPGGNNMQAVQTKDFKQRITPPVALDASPMHFMYIMHMWKK
jgi:hypothetical protein